jgi:hypothetical protein
MSRAVTETFERQIKDHGFPEPELEMGFHASRKWRFDYAWPEFKIAVEISAS